MSQSKIFRTSLFFRFHIKIVIFLKKNHYLFFFVKIISSCMAVDRSMCLQLNQNESLFFILIRCQFKHLRMKVNKTNRQVRRTMLPAKKKMTEPFVHITSWLFQLPDRKRKIPYLSLRLLRHIRPFPTHLQGLWLLKK